MKPVSMLILWRIKCDDHGVLNSKWETLSEFKSLWDCIGHLSMKQTLILEKLPKAVIPKYLSFVAIL